MITGCTEEKQDLLKGKHQIEIEVETYGIIKAELDADSAPITVTNFLHLVEQDFYDGLTFHRIIKDFMMQGGDASGTDKEVLTHNITGEFTANKIHNPLKHTRGALSMARSQAYNSASSQFFIVQKESSHLDGIYAAFGYVTEGMDIVDQICNTLSPADESGIVEENLRPVIKDIRVIG